MRNTIKLAAATMVTAVACMLGAATATAVTTLEPANTTVSANSSHILLMGSGYMIDCLSNSAPFTVPSAPGNVIPASPATLNIPTNLAFANCFFSSNAYNASMTVLPGTGHQLKFGRSATGSPTVALGLQAGVTFRMNPFGPCQFTLGAATLPLFVNGSGGSINSLAASYNLSIATSTCPGIAPGSIVSFSTVAGGSYVLNPTASLVTQ